MPAHSSANLGYARPEKRKVGNAIVLTALSQTGCPTQDLGAAIGQRTDPDLRIRTPADSPDIRHGTTDQKVGGSSPSERAQVRGGPPIGRPPFWCPKQAPYSRMYSYMPVGRVSSSSSGVVSVRSAASGAGRARRPHRRAVDERQGRGAGRDLLPIRPRSRDAYRQVRR